MKPFSSLTSSDFQKKISLMQTVTEKHQQFKRIDELKERIDSLRGKVPPEKLNEIQEKFFELQSYL